jgi:hypothetical protein
MGAMIVLSMMANVLLLVLEQKNKKPALAQLPW